MRPASIEHLFHRNEKEMTREVKKTKGSSVPPHEVPSAPRHRQSEGSLDDLVTPPRETISNENRTTQTNASPEASKTTRAPVLRLVEKSQTHSTENSSTKETAPLLGAIKKLSSAFSSTFCFCLTGVFNQAARGNTTDVSQFPDPFLYCLVRSTVASVASFFKERTYLQKTGIIGAFKEIGPHGRLMSGLMAANNLLWVPAFMLTDLASASVISGAQPFIHSIYESIRARKLPSPLKVTGLAFMACALSTVVLNQSNGTAHYPHAMWGNLAGFAASMCFLSYMTLNNHFVESAKNKAVSPADIEAARNIPSPAERKQREEEHESMRSQAQSAVQAQLRTVPLFSQVASAFVGLSLFIPLAATGISSGGLGLDPTNTLLMASLHGIFTAAGLYLRTHATQVNKPSIVSLVSGIQVGVTPLLGYLLFGSPVPQFAMIAGALAFCSTLTSVAEVHQIERKKQQQRS